MSPRFLPRFALAVLILVLPASTALAVEVQRVISPGGVEAWLVEDHSNPIISVQFAFRGSAALDPAGKEGLANMASGLLDEGAGPLDSQAFQERLASLSIRLSFDAGLDNFRGEMQTLTENADTAFDLLRLAVSEPRFDPEPLERIRGQILSMLKRESNDPGRIASRTLRRLLFGEHPYARPVNGTIDSVQALTAEDFRRFAAARLVREGLVVAVVGDITADDLARQLDRSFGKLPATADSAVVAEITPAATGEFLVVEQDVPQSVVAMGHAGLKRDDPDFFAAYIVNYVLGGGGFSSRLYSEVREKRGLAYSVYSYLSPLDHAGLVMGGVATQNAAVAESIEIMRAEWRRMAESGPTAEELRDAKTYLTGSYPLRFSSSGRIARILVGIQLEDLGIDYINERNALIEAVTLEDAERVARRLYDPEALTVVVVGMPEGLEAARRLSDGGGETAPAADGASESALPSQKRL